MTDTNAMEQLSRDDFESSVRRASNPVIVVFTADWAENADEYEDALDTFVDQFGETVDLFRVDVDDEGRLTNDFQISDVPTFLGFYQGNVLFRVESDELDDPEDALELADKLTNLPGAAA